MLSPKKFSEIANISYQQTLLMCRNGEIRTIETSGGHFKIYESELELFKNKKDFISREEYEQLIRENEKLKNTIEQLKIFLNNTDF